MGQSAPCSFSTILRQLQEKLYPNPKIEFSSGLAQLGVLLSATIGLTFWFNLGPVAANSLFQSPQSPVEQPVPIEQPPPVEQPVPVEQPPAQPPLIEQPVLVEQPPEAVPVEAPPVVAPESPVAQPVPVQPAPEQPPAAEQAPAAPPMSEPAAPQPSRREREDTLPAEEESSGPSQFILDQAEFIDTVVVSGAYVWLCCGVGLFLLVPLALLFFYIRGRSKIINRAGY